MKRKMARTFWPPGDARKVMIIVPLLVLVVAASGYWGNHLLRRLSLNSTDYLLAPENILLNEPPQWITASDVKSDVVRDASLNQASSILDDRLTQRVALAFAAHPWVGKVVRVEKFHPARVEVTVEYRHPIAAVNANGQWIPIDPDGVPLPSEDFSAVEIGDFPQIIGITSQPTGGTGVAWSDARVRGGAIIATAFGTTWKRLGLDRIVPSARPVHERRDVFTFDLYTQAGTRIPWGPQYLDKNPSEPSAEQKRDMLMDYVERYGKLDGFSFRDTPNTSGPRTAESPEHDKRVKQ